jgi:hypothetical protein
MKIPLKKFYEESLFGKKGKNSNYAFLKLDSIVKNGSRARDVKGLSFHFVKERYSFGGNKRAIRSIYAIDSRIIMSFKGSKVLFMKLSTFN